MMLESMRESLGTGSTGSTPSEDVLRAGELVLDSPAVIEGVLYAESSDGNLRALDAATGEALWQFQKGYFNGIRGYTVADGTVYVSAPGRQRIRVHCPPGTERAEKVLTILYWQAPSVPSPYLSGGNKDEDAGAITLEPLANYDPAGNLVPTLAARVPTLENGGFSQDLMSITWILKEGLRWSDGSNMTAEDVVFTGATAWMKPRAALTRTHLTASPRSKPWIISPSESHSTPHALSIQRIRRAERP